MTAAIEQIKKSLQSCEQPVCIVGVGNRLRADDAAGCLVLDRLDAKRLCAKLIDAGTAPENYIGPVRKLQPRSLIIIDAVDFGAAPGDVRLLRPCQLDATVFSTHSLSPRVFVDMVCGDHTCTAWMIGIQPEGAAVGGAVNDRVSLAVSELATAISKVFDGNRMASGLD